MRTNYWLFSWIALAGLSCAGQEKDPNTVWNKAGADEGLRQAFERVAYRLEDSGVGQYRGVNPAQRLALEFNSDEARLKHPQGDVALRLTGYGYGSRLRTPLAATPAVSGTGCITIGARRASTLPPDAYQAGDPANLLIGDSYVTLTNAGTRNGFDPDGGICADVYVFDPSEELIACCACYVSPDGLRSLSVKQDLVSDTFTPGVPGSITIKLLASTPVTRTTCDPSSPTLFTLEPGLRAWGTDLHQNTTTGAYQVTENAFLNADLSPTELDKLTTYCGFIQANGSSYGICKSCQFGGLGGARLLRNWRQLVGT